MIAFTKPVRSWMNRQDSNVVLLAIVLLTCALFNLAVFGPKILDGQVKSDFFVFWSASMFLASGEAVTNLYDWDILTEFQKGFTWYVEGSIHPFAYPPSYIFFILPIHHLDLPEARIVWNLTSFLFAAWALECHRYPWRFFVLAAAPATMINMGFGQNGLLTAGLIAGGLLRLERRPVLAGILLGIATIKPQLGLAIPLLLLVQKRFVTIIAATLTASILIATSAWIFGVDAWFAWFDHLDKFSHSVPPYIEALGPVLISLQAFLLLHGISFSLSAYMHLYVSLIALGLFFLMVRNVRQEIAIAMTLILCLILSPFSYIYDCVLIVPAIILMAECVWKSNLCENDSVLARCLLITGLTTPLLHSFSMINGFAWTYTVLIVLFMVPALLVRLNEPEHPFVPQKINYLFHD